MSLSVDNETGFGFILWRLLFRSEDDDRLKTAMAQEEQEDDLQGARPANYDILKNREAGRPGERTRARKRDRNPRVKARFKFKKALKRRKSQVPSIRSQSRPYGGETSGIRAGMVRARKLKI